MKDSFQTIAGPSTGEFRDRGSRFLAYAFPVSTEEEWQACLESVKKDHPKARHHCFAFRLGIDKNLFRANDDGEPSGTAGRPILGQIDSFQLTDILVVVVRYFGGTLLGTSGLIQAYRQSTQQALEQATIVDVILQDRIRVAFDYAWMGEVMNAVKKLNMTIASQHFEEEAYIDLLIRKSEVEAQLIQLKAMLAKVSLEEATQMEQMEGVSMQRV